MQGSKEDLARLGRSILAYSRNELYFSMRFLDLALSELRYEMDLTTPRAGTDGVSIRYNTRFLYDLYVQDPVMLNRAYMHMLLHCLFRHPYHRGGRDELLWDLACDMAVESVIDSIEAKPVQVLIPERREQAYTQLRERMTVITAENVYRFLLGKSWGEGGLMRWEQEFRVDDHRFWPEDEEGEDDSPDGDDQDRQENREQEKRWEDLSQKTQAGMETFYATYGKDAGDLLQTLRVENRERTDYTRFLQKFMTLREHLRQDMDSFDYAYYNYGMERYGNIPLIEPLEYREDREIEELVIVIDTSESCAEGKIKEFLEKTYGILAAAASGGRRLAVHIVQCDAKVQSDTLITKREELDRYMQRFEVRGFGGTDFRPAFEYVDKLRAAGGLRQLRGLLYFTDGFGEYPSKQPGYETAFVFLDKQYHARRVPPWAIQIILEEAEDNRI